MLRKFTSSPSRMIEWKAEIEIQYLQPDGIEVCFFSDLVDGGQYRAVCKSDDRKYHDQVEDALECATYTEHHSSAQAYYNDQLRNNACGKQEGDEGIRCNRAWRCPTVGFLVDAK
jgi:hypothetical protein